MLCENRLKKYSRRERNLIYTVLFLISVVLIFIIVLIAISTRGSNICLTPNCIKTATYFINSIDPNVDPCDNFHDFVCGGFMNRSMVLQVPTHLYGLNNLKKYQMKEIVTEPPDEENKEIPNSVYLQRKFYAACINTTAIDDDKDQTFLELLEEVIGGWPMIKGTAWNEADFDWIKSMEKARQMGLEYRFFFDVTLSMVNRTKVLKIGPSTFLITINENAKKFEKIIEAWSSQIFVGLSSQIGLVNTFSEQLDVIAEKAKNITSQKGYEPKKTTISKLKNLRFIRIHWLPFLKNITGLQQLEETDEIVVDDMDEYFKDLYYLMMKTPKRVQANYIAIIFIKRFAGYLSKKVQQTFPTYLQYSDGKNSSRSDFCFKEAVSMFPSVAEGEYVRRYATQEVQGDVKKMTKLIKQEFKYAIESNTFMDDLTKRKSLELLAVIKENVGWTDTVYDAEKYEKVFGYDKITVSTTDNVLTMARKMMKYNIDCHFQRYTKSTDYESNDPLIDLEFDRPDITVNAYFVPIFNALMLTAPILQPPVYDINRPKFSNFGILGSIAGHEFTHAFADYKGKTIGEEKNITIWSNETVQKYQQLTECVVDDYEKYPNLLDNFSKNGSAVLRELIADFTGADLSYRAYQKWTSKNGYEASFPSLPYTANQMFWISLGSLYCYQYELRDLDDVINIDGNHPVPSYRIVGTLKNSPYFAEDFNCPLGSQMNPEHKCRIFL